jgi:hypothetical protein
LVEVLIRAVEIRSGGGERKGKAHQRGARVPTTCAMAPCNSSNAELLEACGRDDGVRGNEASLWVVAAAIGSRWCARVLPEAAGAAALELAIWQTGGGVLRAVWWRKERGKGVYIGVEDLGDGLGLGRCRCNRKVSGSSVTGPVSMRRRRWLTGGTCLLAAERVGVDTILARAVSGPWAEIWPRPILSSRPFLLFF